MEVEQYPSSETAGEKFTTEEFRETLDLLPEEKKVEVKNHLLNGEMGKAIDEVFAARKSMEVGRDE